MLYQGTYYSDQQFFFICNNSILLIMINLFLHYTHINKNKMTVTIKPNFTSIDVGYMNFNGTFT